MPARPQIPFGSILAQLHQRSRDQYNADQQRKRQRASFTNSLMQLGGMAVGGALGGPLGVGMMAGAGLGGTGGGLLGSAVTGTPVTMNQGINALMQVGGLMEGQARTGEMAKRTALYQDKAMLDVGYAPLPTDLAGEPMADDITLGGKTYTPTGLQPGGRGAFTMTQTWDNPDGSKTSAKWSQSNAPDITPAADGFGEGTQSERKWGQVYDQGAPIDSIPFGDPRWNDALERGSGRPISWFEQRYGPSRTIPGETRTGLFGIDFLKRDIAPDFISPRDVRTQPALREQAPGTKKRDSLGIL